MNILRITSLSFLVVLLIACAGKQFVKPTAELLELGKTTKNEVLAAMGEPESSSTITVKDHDVVHLFYGYAEAFGSKTLGRSASFFFVGNVLVGHQFVSEFPGESTDFDLTKANQIIEKKSTYKDVIVLLGKPTGEAIYPLADNPKGESLTYRYHGDNAHKNVVIELDENRIVQEFSVQFKRQ